jgi:hypothetical protein
MDDRTISNVLTDHICARAQANEMEEQTIQRMQEKLAEPAAV